MANTKIRWPGGLLDKALDARDELVERLRPHVERARRGNASGLLARLAQHRENGAYLPIEEVVNHVMLLFWAGYDTTASAGSWILHLLAHHPEWQERIRRETFEVLGDRPYQLTGSGRLQSITMFLREVERYAPSLIMFPRQATADFEFGGHTVPKGTVVFYSPWMTHRCPEAFPHPHSFDPSRWDPERGDDQAKGKYMVGFGGGPRLCLGRQFAQMQLRILITTLVRRFHIEPDPTTSFHIMGLPVHHPVDSRLHFRNLLAYQKPVETLADAAE
ncbi:MAG: cytochrome P450 [Polyangiaceae bacterium]|nr:cytochrome P450 [Polyangiaceae bacterium]